METFEQNRSFRLLQPPPGTRAACALPSFFTASAAAAAIVIQHTSTDWDVDVMAGTSKSPINPWSGRDTWPFFKGTREDQRVLIFWIL